MASRKLKNGKLPPMWSKVVAAEHLESAAARSRFFQAMLDLWASGLMELVGRQVRAERGVWLREGHRWPAAIRRHAKLYFQAAAQLEELVRACARVGDEGVPAELRRGLEAEALRWVQALMDACFEAGKHEYRGAPAGLAGLSQVGVDWSRLHASSGVEAAMNLAFGTRRAVLGKAGSPFWPYVVPKEAVRGMRKQAGRKQPGSWQELLPDDLSILRACRAGSLGAKQLAAKVRLSVSHVSKRKADLQKWGLLAATRPFTLSHEARRAIDGEAL